MTSPETKRIAITGAGSGLGRALALRYARDGWRVAVTDIDAERAERVAREIEAAGGQALALALDTRREADFAALVEQLIGHWVGLDVFVNNAGVAGAGRVTEAPLEDWAWLLDVNLMGVVRGARAVMPLLRDSRGHLVNIASFAAIASTPGMAAYNATKAAVFSLSETLRAEEYDSGVGVTVVCPAFFATNLMDNFRGGDRHKAIMAKLMARAPLSADDVAGDVFDAVAAGRFLVIPHKDSHRQYLLKRLMPERFFRLVLASTRSFVRES